MAQLSLNVTLPDAPDFVSFYTAPGNEEVVSLLQTGLWQELPQLFIFGEQGTGKSHLLQAACHAAGDFNLSASFLSMNELAGYSVNVLEGLNQRDLLVLDDIDVIVGNRPWEEALFHLINQCRQDKQTLLMSAKKSPRSLNCLIADLHSRLLWGPIYQLDRLTEEQAIAAFKIRAQLRGLELSDQVLRYISKHLPRDIQYLMLILDKLDAASFSRGKKVTVKMLSDTLSNSMSL